MKIWLKQLFCSHIWKTTDAEVIGEGTRNIYDIPIKGYKRYAVTSVCVKCAKSKITEEKIYHDLPLL